MAPNAVERFRKRKKKTKKQKTKSNSHTIRNNRKPTMHLYIYLKKTQQSTIHVM